MHCAKPRDIENAVAIARKTGAPFVSGGCEIAWALRCGRSVSDCLISLGGIQELLQLEAHPKRRLSIGACVKLAQIANHIWIAKRWAALHESVVRLSPPQLRTIGTLVGNVCAAGPHHDMVTALIALKAHVYTAGPTGQRKLPVEAFYPAPRTTALGLAELVCEVEIKPPNVDAGSASLRLILGRPGFDPNGAAISVASYLALDALGGTVVEATIAVGGIACPWRARAAEASLMGAAATEASFAAAAELAADQAKRAWDGEANTRHFEMVRVLAKDVLTLAALRARSRHDPFEHPLDLMPSNVL